MLESKYGGIGEIGRRGGFRSHSFLGAGSSPVSRITKLMPQLDVLTYFSQFVYLLISFIAVYVFIHSTVIPKIVSAQKLRQKVNSVSRLTAKLNAAPVPISYGLIVGTNHSVDDLRSSKWYSSTSPRAAWPTCARALQIAAAQSIKKRFCGLIFLRTRPTL
jgi:hypothetical protein